ncbi:hypothetical protein [Wolbachia endosymbiont (group A) of Platycheirus albimanus]|uniref:hypothetical protein n=1 Tax=Wolbachia endosymbiont (group A) of Platycheirus albimanus TaxID=2954048 RepID=UPI0022211B53|nr:hypothetical protein [Wolbachia endosymbiont (group A) of Platycheirus albimanus]
MLRDTANESRYDGVDSNSSSRYVLAGSLVSGRDTANESRYDVGLLSSQCVGFVASLFG